MIILILHVKKLGPVLYFFISLIFFYSVSFESITKSIFRPSQKHQNKNGFEINLDSPPT